MRMKVFYLDSFLVLNLVLDYLLLLLTAKISGIWVQRYKLWLGAVFGAVFATGMFFFSGSGFAGFLLSVAAVWVMISLIFRNQSRIKRLRLAGIFFLLNLVFSGMMILLQNVGVGRISVQNGIPYIQMEFWQILASATGGFLLVRLCFRDHSAPIEKHRVHFHGELRQRKLDTLLLADSGNLLFVGGTGLGKTMLSACIATTVTEKGYAVSYESAVHLFSKLEKDRFNPTEESRREVSEIFHADLLIIDDLGTEMPGNFVTTALYTLVNDRLMDGKPTIISTNLNADELGQRYSPQIASRLHGIYRQLTFVGEDIRLIKR